MDCLVCKCFVLPFDDPPLSALQSFSSLEFHPLKSFSPLDPPVQAVPAAADKNISVCIFVLENINITIGIMLPSFC